MSLDFAIESILKTFGYDIDLPLNKMERLSFDRDGRVTLINREVVAVQAGNATIKLGKKVTARVAPEGILDIEGVEVDIPGPFDPNITNIRVEQGRLIVETTVSSHTIDLPRRV